MLLLVTSPRNCQRIHRCDPLLAQTQCGRLKELKIPTQTYAQGEEEGTICTSFAASRWHLANKWFPIQSIPISVSFLADFAPSTMLWIRDHAVNVGYGIEVDGQDIVLTSASLWNGQQ